MKITVNRPNYNTLEFVLQEGRHDGAPPLKKIYFSGPKLGRLKDSRIGLIGFLLVQDLLSSVLQFEGVHIPIFFAKVMSESAGLTELFVSPVTTAEYALQPKETKRTQAWNYLPTDRVDGDAGDTVYVKRHDLGFVAIGPEVSEKLQNLYSTNASMFLTLVSRQPEWTYRSIIACILFDVFAAPMVAGAIPTSDLAASRLLSEVGFSFQGEA